MNLIEYKNLEIFQNIKDSTILKILSEGEVKKYTSGNIVFYDKEDVNHVYIVIEGAVSLYKNNENGQKKVIFMLGKGKVINEVILQDLPASINCELFQNSTLLSIRKDLLLEIMEEDFDLCKNIIISLSNKTRRMYRQLKNTPSSVKIEKRLAAKLYKLALDYGKECTKGICIDMDLTITYIADLLGSPRETVSRAMKKLQSEKLVEYKYKRVFIYNLKELSIFFKTS